MALTQVPVTGTYVWEDGLSPVPTGTVTFTEHSAVTQNATPVTTTKVFTLVNGMIPDGSWVYALTGDVAVSPASNYYTITEAVGGNVSTETREVTKRHRYHGVDLGMNPIPRGRSSVSRALFIGSATKTLSREAGLFVFTGSGTTTWTLPDVVSNTGLSLKVKNRGSATLTLAGATGTVYDTSAGNSLSVTAGSVVEVISDGTYWLKV